ncbi:hypothetical protein EGR_01459 [Echinococcus granulosus]|uniref:Uncharacterized protein n=1 Tax=Echinococcus granulosus TaxID=6210 RepID=W6UT12_ECHGR|nr:hypothetical protein EGR_01459 [Echinococcus granulosus]EUB63836.1 hypothetical protein EGR_01459 [Echinococcus granulosus]
MFGQLWNRKHDLCTTNAVVESYETVKNCAPEATTKELEC